jgi:hypothetical protein
MALFQPDHAVVIPLIRLCGAHEFSGVMPCSSNQALAFAASSGGVLVMLQMHLYTTAQNTVSFTGFSKSYFSKKASIRARSRLNSAALRSFTDFLISFIHSFLLFIDSVLSFRCVYVNAIMPASHLPNYHVYTAYPTLELYHPLVIRISSNDAAAVGAM